MWFYSLSLSLYLFTFFFVQYISLYKGVVYYFRFLWHVVVVRRRGVFRDLYVRSTPHRVSSKFQNVIEFFCYFFLFLYTFFVTFCTIMLMMPMLKVYLCVCVLMCDRWLGVTVWRLRGSINVLKTIKQTKGKPSVFIYSCFLVIDFFMCNIFSKRRVIFTGALP